MTQETEATADRDRLPTGRWWTPLLVTSAVAFVIGAVALVFSQGDGQERPPAASLATSTSTPSSTPSTSSTSSGAPSTPEATLDAVLVAAAVGDLGRLPDADVVGDGEWAQLVGYVDGQGGAAAGCRDNGGGTRDCELRLEADPSRVYYAILEPQRDGSGWRISYVSMADG
jgi:hypothetical protein